MKNIICISMVLMLVLLVAPLISLKSEDKTTDTKPEKQAVSAAVYTAEKIKSKDFKVLMSDSGEVVKMSGEDYIFGVVAAEMPALYEEEALKAQAVAAYSFAIRRRSENKDKQYDISTDHTKDQAYISEQAATEKWGENAGVYIEKIRNAVKAVAGKTVNYKGEVALTLYHAISSGKTESAKAVWGGDIKYLCSVDSISDKLSPDYLSVVEATADELAQKLGEKYSFSSSGNDIKITEQTDVGSVKKLKICGKEISAEELREKLGLRSVNFTVDFKEGKYVFNVKGYGHGVGMSQYGANYMAKQGADYIEILKHYYKGVTVG